MTEGEHSMEDRARIFAPVLAQVKRLADEGKPVAIAIDGRCGSGKTWLSGLIGDRFPCNILHMDDFYLPLGDGPRAGRPSRGAIWTSGGSAMSC